MSTSEPGLDSTISPAATRAPALTRKHTVLLVEDDAAVRRYLEVILRRAGYEVIPAANGLEAIKAALSAKIDAVVTDALMPHLSGHELCRYLRARPELSRLPILLLSGLEPNAAAPEQSEHADAHLTKPVRPEVFTDCLASLLDAAGRA
ncbi:MAG TPA: response regulator [Pyrinomonadaceae bacterium]|nr:response regulator [Pyrinomonadaceae bacterium]